MKPEQGTYALILQNHNKRSIQVGRLELINIEPGFYIYVGSAFGPGGVKARVSRHLCRKKTRHWHIDYMGKFMEPYFVWYSHDKNHLEHIWAQKLSGINGISSVRGFGCSDCKCTSHFFHSATQPDLAEFSDILDGNIKTWMCIVY